MPSIAKELRLPAFEPGQPLAWPPRPRLNQTRFAPTPYDLRFSARWWEAESGSAASKSADRLKSNRSPPSGTTIKAPRPFAIKAELTAATSPLCSALDASQGTTPSAVLASPSSTTAMPDPEPKPMEVIATDAALLAACSESVLATATSGPRGAETNANTTPSTGGMLSPEYLPGDVSHSVADNLTDDIKNRADRGRQRHDDDDDDRVRYHGDGCGCHSI